MTFTSPIHPQEEAKLMAAARAKGVTATDVVRVALNRIVAEVSAEASSTKELTRSMRGLLAKYGPAPSTEEIDENRAEMLANFPRNNF